METMWKLPPDVIHELFVHLDNVSLFSLSLTCHVARNLLVAYLPCDGSPFRRIVSVHNVGTYARASRGLMVLDRGVLGLDPIYDGPGIPTLARRFLAQVFVLHRDEDAARWVRRAHHLGRTMASHALVCYRRLHWTPDLYALLRTACQGPRLHCLEIRSLPSETNGGLSELLAPATHMTRLIIRGDPGPTSLYGRPGFSVFTSTSLGMGACLTRWGDRVMTLVLEEYSVQEESDLVHWETYLTSKECRLVRLDMKRFLFTQPAFLLRMAGAIGSGAHSLVSLNLSHWACPMALMDDPLVPLLQTTRTLQKLSLHAMDRPFGASLPIHLLRQRTRLHSLTLSRARLGPASLAILVLVGPSLKTLQSLDLAHNTVDNHGLVMLARLLTHGPPRLRKLRLASNILTSTKVHVVAEALMNNTILQTLDLSDNFIDEHGLECLLRHARHLRALYMDLNQIRLDLASLHQMRRLALTHTPLLTLSLRYNPLVLTLAQKRMLLQHQSPRALHLDL